MSRTLPMRVRLAVFERDGWACVYCQQKLARPEDWYEVPPLTYPGGHCGCGLGTLNTRTGCFVCVGCDGCAPGLAIPDHLAVGEIDHVLARANGGTDDLENLAASCGPCNAKKGAR